MNVKVPAEVGVPEIDTGACALFRASHPLGPEYYTAFAGSWGKGYVYVLQAKPCRKSLHQAEIGTTHQLPVIPRELVKRAIVEPYLTIVSFIRFVPVLLQRFRCTI